MSLRELTAEQHVIGWLLANPDDLPKDLWPGDFGCPTMRMLFEAILEVGGFPDVMDIVTGVSVGDLALLMASYKVPMDAKVKAVRSAARQRAKKD